MGSGRQGQLEFRKCREKQSEVTIVGDWNFFNHLESVQMESNKNPNGV